jgi:hypothetical protein
MRPICRQCGTRRSHTCCQRPSRPILISSSRRVARSLHFVGCGLELHARPHLLLVNEQLLPGEMRLWQISAAQCEQPSLKPGGRCRPPGRGLHSPETPAQDGSGRLPDKCLRTALANQPEGVLCFVELL